MNKSDKKDFLPILIGSDLNAYTMSLSFYEEYGITPIIVAKTPISSTDGCTIIEKKM